MSRSAFSLMLASKDEALDAKTNEIAAKDVDLARVAAEHKAAQSQAAAEAEMVRKLEQQLSDTRNNL